MMLRSALLSLMLLVWALVAMAPASAQTVAESRVAASTDDAEEREDGSISVIGSDLELGWDGDPQTLGMRFPNLQVPPGASVSAAWVQFEADESASTDLTVTFTTEASDDAGSFSTSDEDITSRPREAPSVDWTPPPWSAGDEGPAQQTPDLSALVQAVVDRPGWAQGNALVLIVEGPPDGTTRRTATSWNSDPAHAPLLHVVYDTPPPTTTTTTTTTSTTTTTAAASTTTTTTAATSTTTTTNTTPTTTTTTLPGQPPTVAILSPVDMSQFPDAQDVTLSATANDPEQGDLSSSLVWTSSLDGIVGIGGSVSTPLSVGIHTLTADVQDAVGHTASASVDVRVTPEGYLLLTAGDIADCNTFFGDEATADILDERFGAILTLGDNAYPDGTAEDFQDCFESSWGRHKARIHPALGNHEYGDDDAEGYFEYFGAAAGDPSKGYYSFDLGDWHIVVLNSMCSEIGGCDATDPQGLWLEADLAANPSACSIAVTHHARYSSGEKHGSKDWLDQLYDIFHSHGGDLFLSGHDHVYERFGPQDAFGNFDATGPRQFVVGTGGVNLREIGDIEPNSVTSAGNLFGVLELTLYEGSYAWEFVPAAGYTYTDSGSASCVGTAEPPRNTPPEVSIAEPTPGTAVPENTAVSFSGSASDAEDGPLSAALSWSSSQDGVIGTGASFVSSSLSAGFHQIQVSVQDSSGESAMALTTLDVQRPASFTIEQRIGDGDDDAEEELSGPNNVSLDSSDLELGEDKSEQLIGLRFDGLDIPQGVAILDAWLQFQAAGSSSTSTDLEIRVEDTDDASPFRDDRHDLSDRDLSTTFVAWSPPDWSGGDQGAAQQSPSLVDLVQETVDRAGWAPGNSLVLMISGEGVRRAESYDGSSSDAPLLHVRYRNPDWRPPPVGGAGCGIGPELALALPLLTGLRRWRRAHPA